MEISQEVSEELAIEKEVSDNFQEYEEYLTSAAVKGGLGFRDPEDKTTTILPKVLEEPELEEQQEVSDKDKTSTEFPEVSSEESDEYQEKTTDKLPQVSEELTTQDKGTGRSKKFQVTSQENSYDMHVRILFGLF